jgi:glutamate synthase (NADPH/NADH)
VSLAQGGRSLRGAALLAAQQRPRPLPWAERASARRHDGVGVVASASSAAAGVRSMSRIPKGNTGLYDPSMDRDSCGVGFIAELSAQPSRKTVSAFATTRALLGVHNSFILPC